jgi:hypothetical protein
MCRNHWIVTHQPKPPSPLETEHHDYTDSAQKQHRDFSSYTPTTLRRLLRRLALIIPITPRNRNHKPIIRVPTIHSILLRDRIAPEHALDDRAAGRIRAPWAQV